MKSLHRFKDDKLGAEWDEEDIPRRVQGADR